MQNLGSYCAGEDLKKEPSPALSVCALTQLHGGQSQHLSKQNKAKKHTHPWDSLISLLWNLTIHMQSQTHEMTYVQSYLLHHCLYSKVLKTIKPATTRGPATSAWIPIKQGKAV